MQSLPRPKISKKSKDYTQTTYNSPNKILCSKIYPIPRPTQGTSTGDQSLLILGHADGITIVWRGFIVEHSKKRKLKELEEKARSKQQGKLARDASNMKGMLSDSGVFDDDASDVVMATDRPASQCSSFVNLELEKDALERKKTEEEAVCRHINFGVGVVSIATLPTTVATTGMLPGGSLKKTTLKLIKDNIVFAVGGMDNSTRLISVPINPMVETEPEIIKLSGMGEQRKVPTPNSMSLSLKPTLEAHDQLVLATASRDGNGVFHLWKIDIKEDATTLPLLEKPGESLSDSLSSPATSLSFHPTNPNLLLISDEKGSVRVGEINYTTKSTKWTAIAQGRKVLGVEWCLGGNGIVVLWAAGDWGVWTIEKAGYTYRKMGKLTAPAGSKRGFVSVTPQPVQSQATPAVPEICVLCLNDSLTMVPNLQKFVELERQKKPDETVPPPLTLDQPFLGGEHILSVTSQVLRSTIQSQPTNPMTSSQTFPSFSQGFSSQPSSQALYMEPPQFRDQTQITILAPTTHRIHLLKLAPTFHATTNNFISRPTSPGPSSQRFGNFSPIPSGASTPSSSNRNNGQLPPKFRSTPYPTDRYHDDDEMLEDHPTNGTRVETRQQAKRKRLQETDPSPSASEATPGLITGMAQQKKRKRQPLRLNREAYEKLSPKEMDAYDREREEDEREDREREIEAIGTATPSVKAFGFRVWG